MFQFAIIAFGTVLKLLLAIPNYVAMFYESSLHLYEYVCDILCIHIRSHIDINMYQSYLIAFG